jgi:hypothetical protein
MENTCMIKRAIVATIMFTGSQIPLSWLPKKES